MSEIKRKLARIETIHEVVPIPDADSIELAKIGGWQCVVKKGEFIAGDKCVYFEVDSFLPVRDEFEFLRKSSFKSTLSGDGFRLKTIKLRGQLSQGLALPLASLGLSSDTCNEKEDMTEVLGVTKWDPPLPANIGGDIKGHFPILIPKTDEERIQNLSDKWEELKSNTYCVTEKLDGTSFTAFSITNAHFGVCSRNFELKETESNTHWQVARKLNLQNVLCGSNSWAIQGELMGPGIQGNKYKLTQHKLFVFHIFCIDTREYLTLEQTKSICDMYNLDMVPILETNFKLPETMEELLSMADGDSLVGPCKREGIVFRTLNMDNSFKVISNQWLLKNDQ